MSAMYKAFKRKNYNFFYRIFFNKKKQIIPYEKADCNICFNDIDSERNFYFNCEHGEFCKSCLDLWVGRSNTCPICRSN